MRKKMNKAIEAINEINLNERFLFKNRLGFWDTPLPNSSRMSPRGGGGGEGQGEKYCISAISQNQEIMT